MVLTEMLLPGKGISTLAPAPSFPSSFITLKAQVSLKVFILAAENVKKKLSFPAHIQKLHAWNHQTDMK